MKENWYFYIIYWNISNKKEQRSCVFKFLFTYLRKCCEPKTQSNYMNSRLETAMMFSSLQGKMYNYCCTHVHTVDAYYSSFRPPCTRQHHSLLAGILVRRRRSPLSGTWRENLRKPLRVLVCPGTHTLSLKYIFFKYCINFDLSPVGASFNFAFADYFLDRCLFFSMQKHDKN